MLNYALLSKKPSNFKNFTGLEVPEFDALNIKIQEKYDAHEEKRLAREDRKRTVGAGHPSNSHSQTESSSYSSTITSTLPQPY
jgi:ABC-type oligopeptide transport system substrate-binding subunit